MEIGRTTWVIAIGCMLSGAIVKNNQQKFCRIEKEISFSHPQPKTP